MLSDYSKQLRSRNTLSIPWLLFTLFWGLFLLFAPVETDWRNASLSDMSSFTYNLILVLEQMRYYIAKPLLCAGSVFVLRSAIHLPFTIPIPVRKVLYITGSFLAALGLINGVRFTFAVYFGIGSLPFYTWLNFHTWAFSLWMTIAAITLSLSSKETQL